METRNGFSWSGSNFSEAQIPTSQGYPLFKKKKQKTPDSHKDLWEAWPQILPETWDLTLGVRPGHTAPIPEM